MTRKKPSAPRWPSIEKMMLAAASMIRPSARITVAEWAANHRYLNTPGAYVGPWLNATTPYLIEIMETLTSLDHTGMIIMGPARSGKSDVLFNWLGYSVDCDPADMRVYLQTKFWAEDWSQGDLEKALLAKPPGQKQSVFQKHMLPGKHGNTMTRKRFLSGMKLNLSWPAITELSGKTVSRLWLNDYDHMEQDVNKMGSPFKLAKKRATTFKRFGMCVAESTPAFPVNDINWIASTPHQAPPVDEGVAKLYNEGDRRRWYWKCPNDECGETFEPSFDLFVYDMLAGSNAKIGATVTMPCPCCGLGITEAMRDTIHAGYPETCRWLKDGQTWDRDGVVHGEVEINEIASFWLKGPAAFAQSWSGMVTEYLNALNTYEQSGSASDLKANFELSQGEPFRAPRNEMARLPETLKGRAEDWGAGHTFEDKEPSVPDWVRFLVATVDVQARSFVVQVTGMGEFGEMTIVDAFKIRYSARVDEHDIRKPLLPIDPAGYSEDWDFLISDVIERTYPLADGSGRRMAIKISGCDSGGREGVTANAYDFWRRLRDDPQGRHHDRRFHLIKGDSAKGAPRRMTRRPDSNQRGGSAIALGDVPVQFFQSNLLKDQLNAILMRTEPGGARMRFPTWMPNFMYKQLCAENRTPKGWEAPSGVRNEAWDLSYYVIGLCIHPDIGIEHVQWDQPERLPAFMRPWDENPMIIMPEEKHPMVQTASKVVDLRAAAAQFI